MGIFCYFGFGDFDLVVGGVLEFSSGRFIGILFLKLV